MPAYLVPGTEGTITITLAGLTSSGSLLAGRASTAVVSGSWADAVVSGFITVGTSPSATSEIRIYVYAQREDTGPAYPDGITGTDAAKTFATAGTRDKLFLAAILGVDATTSDEDRDFSFSLFQVCGFVPKRWGVWVTQSTGATLNGTGGNHKIVYLPYTWDAT